MSMFDVSLFNTGYFKMPDKFDSSDDIESLHELYEEACLKQLLWMKVYRRMGWSWIKMLADSWEITANTTLHTLEQFGQKPHQTSIEEFVHQLPHDVKTAALSQCSHQLNNFDPAEHHDNW